jgi:NodT family efflux transporter outer membrane factor (OMF) lipoprotein
MQDRQQLSEWPEQEAAQHTTSLTELINSAEIDALVQEALSANPGLQQTLITLKILRAEHKQTTADRLPESSLNLQGDKTQNEEQNYSGSLSISWEVDLWQKLADLDSAAATDVAEQEAVLQAARATLAAEVMKEWIGLIGDRHAISIEQRRLANMEQNEKFILQRYRSGIGTLEDLDSARTSSSSSRATLEEYHESLAQRQRSLKTILGRTGTEKITDTSTYPAVITPLADLPEQTLQRRPDLQAAYLAIEAADKRTSAAYKDLLPSISLETALEDIGDSAQSMLLTDPVWALLGQLTAPLFQGGKLKAAAEVTELETAKSYQVYRETLLTAINEVEDALGLEKSLGRQTMHIESALANSHNSLARYQESYRAGLVDILDLLNVQQQTFDLELQLDNLNNERLTNRIDLGLALGLGVYQ